MEKLITTHGEFDLQRWPVRSRELLRAWDAADQYLLATVGEERPATPLVINDVFGALSVALAHAQPVLWSDSHLTRLALAHNLRRCGRPADAVTFVSADTEPTGRHALVLARFPKSLAFWEDTLLRLRAHLEPGARVLAGGMIKHTPRRAFELMEDILGPTTTGLGWKKARLAEAVFEDDRGLPPCTPDTSYELTGHAITLRNGPNVFAREHLDVGTRALLPYLPAGLTGRSADLGCGGGALSLALARLNPDLEVLGVDESYQAVASARGNAAAAGLTEPRVRFEVADGLTDAPRDTFDLVVCNPPFHQDRTVGDQLAWGMFKQAERALVAGGRFLVVGNRHLAHSGRLERIFGGCRQLGETAKFEVLEAVRGGVL